MVATGTGWGNGHNAAVEEKAALLASAGLITPLTAAEIRASYERWHGEREKLRLRQVHFAERCRRLVSLRVSRADLVSIGRAPLSATTRFERVWSDFWRGVLARLCGRPSQALGRRRDCLLTALRIPSLAK